MKIIFEYEDGTYRIVPNLKLSKIDEHDPAYLEVDILISDNGIWKDFSNENPLVNKYIVADDNRLAGFTGHRDIVRLRKEIDSLVNQIDLKKCAIKMCQGDEDLNTYPEIAEVIKEIPKPRLTAWSKFLGWW